jgi:CO/xanthine dehydrogenase FAD-binding subunit
MSFGGPYLTLPNFEYHHPETVEETLDLLQKYAGDVSVMAGGVGLIALMKERLVSSSHVIDIKGVKQLGQTNYIPGDSIRIGASVTLSELSTNDQLRTRFTAVHNAASWIADPILRERATLVGNLCEAIPWVDSPAALISLGASAELASNKGRRSVLVEDFIRGPADIDINPDEFVTEIVVPDIPSRKSAFDKFNTGADFSLATVALSVTFGKEKDVSVVYSAVSTKPVRCIEAEKILEKEEPSPETFRNAANAASENVDCLSDSLASAEYRKQLIHIVTIRALGRVFGK